MAAAAAAANADEEDNDNDNDSFKWLQLPMPMSRRMTTTMITQALPANTPFEGKREGRRTRCARSILILFYY